MTVVASGHYSKQAVSASLGHFVLGRGAGMVLAFALLMLQVRVLAAGAYGTYVVLLSMLEVVCVVSGGWLVVAAQRYLPELRAADRHRALDGLLWRLLGMRALTLALAVAVCWPLTGWIVSFFGVGESAGVVRLYLGGLFFEGLARFVEVCQDSLLRQKASQLGVLLRNALRLAALAVLASGAGTTIALRDWLLIDLAAGAAGCLYGIVNLVRFSRSLPHAEAADDGSDLDARARRYVLPAFGAYLLWTSWNLDTVRLVAARLVGAVQLAPFGFAAALHGMVVRYVPVVLLLNLVRPLFIAARGRGDFVDRLPFMAALMFKLNVFVLAPLLAFIVVAHDPLVDLITGGRLPEAGGFLLLFVPVLLLQAFRGVIDIVAHTMELGRALLLATGLASLGLLAGIAAAGPLGLAALCLGLAASELIWCGVAVSALHRHGMPLSLAPAALARMAVSAVAGGGVSWAVLFALKAQPLPWSLLSAFAAGVAAYLLVARVLRPFEAPERELINAILKRDLFCW